MRLGAFVLRFMRFMDTVNLELYRIRILEGLFGLKKSRSSIIRDAIYERVFVENYGFVWTIGNITFIDEDGLYFRIGRRSGVSLGEYDAHSGRFSDSLTENWPSTHVFCDTRLGVIAIARNNKLTDVSFTVARRIQNALARSKAAQDPPVTILVDPINSSDDFMEMLRKSYSIKVFSFEFTPPNPFDAEELIQKPLENYVKEARGQRGKVEIEGANLNHETVEDTARSAITSGNEVRALIQIERRQRAVLISSKQYPEIIREVFIDTENLANNLEALRRIRSRYEELRLG